MPSSLKGLTVVFNPDFVLDFLKSMPKIGALRSSHCMTKEHGRIHLGIQRPRKGKRVDSAATFKDLDETEATYILMPITEK